jgi:phytoene dehydrogenase-like protein
MVPYKPRRLSRRDFLGGALALGAATAFSGCRRIGEAVGLFDRSIPGELLGPSKILGHKLRDGFSFPPPLSEERVPVVIVGGGAAGLSAGWKLLRSGMKDFVLLELEQKTGGNAAWGQNEVSAYPWGAHYLPVPSPEAGAVRELLTEMKVMLGVGKNGEGVWDELQLCQAPEERLYIAGEWQSGLYPRIGAAPGDMAERDRFLKTMEAFRRRRGKDGRRAFCIPMEKSSRDADLLALDAISMEAWLQREGFTTPRLRWFVEYACRDDFGASLAQTSAWAGIHYFAARPEGAADLLLVWPEGNGHLVRHLADQLGDRVRSNAMAYDVSPDGDSVRVDYLDAATGRTRRIRAKRAVVAMPRFVARHIVAPLRDDHRPSAFSYAPWMTANLTIEDPPEGRGSAPAWDNVIHDSEGLGYVDARHQSISLDERRSVWTYYRPLIGDPDARRKEAYARTHEEWRDICLTDLEKGHPGLRRHVSRLDTWVWGHGMIMPKVGFLWASSDRRDAAKPHGPIHFAHSDLSGISLFEEANYRGVYAAEAVMSALGHPHRSSL